MYQQHVPAIINLVNTRWAATDVLSTCCPYLVLNVFSTVYFLMIYYKKNFETLLSL